MKRQEHLKTSKRNLIIEFDTEAWLMPYREALKNAYLNYLSSYGEHCLSKNRLEEARSASEYMLAIDDLNESAYCLQIAILIEREKNGDAKILYRMYESLLLKRLSVTPSQKNRQMIENITGFGKGGM